MSKDEEIIRDNHESYGMASFSRVSSQGTYLFGSEFKHHNFMTLSISRCERQRDLSRDWYFDREEIIQIQLSESQFVELITTPNMGCGVPCTIQRVQGKRMADPPIRESMKHRYTADMEATTKRATETLRKAAEDFEALIDSGKLGKQALREILREVKSAAMQMDNSVPFVAKQFNEAVEETIAHAKTEVEAHVSAMAMRIGVEQMRLEAKNSSPKLIEGEADPLVNERSAV